jgi:hypothetical protein
LIWTRFFGIKRALLFLISFKQSFMRRRRLKLRLSSWSKMSS